MERTSKTVKTSSQGKIGGAESAANQVGGVSADVSTLVVGVDGEVEPHELNEVLVLGESELVGQVVGVVLILLDRSNLAILVDVAENFSGDGRKLGDEVHGILESVLPVLGLGHTLSVGLGEVGLVLESGDSERELSHGVEGVGAAVDQLLDELGNIGASGPVGGEVADLLLGRNLASEKKPEEAFRKRLLATRGLGKDFLALRDLGEVSNLFNCALGDFYRTVFPRKRIPSSESRTEPYQFVSLSILTFLLF